MRHFGKGWLFTSANGDGGRNVCLRHTLTRKSLENSPVPIEAVALESSVPDDAVSGFEPPLV